MGRSLSATERKVRGPLARLLAGLSAALMLVSLLVALQQPQSADAADKKDFKPGNIISDSQFYDSNAMTQSQIQRFLERKIEEVGGCLNSLCLANLRVNTTNKPHSAASHGGVFCRAYDGEAAESAASIIFKVQRACSISARVILVTLQKEQSLVTSRAPTSGVLKRAMGMGCPDHSQGACDASYNGFFNQVYSASRQFKIYSVDPFGYFQPGFKTVQAHPDSANCPSSRIYIENDATAALYNYTPYRPNNAALNNLYGLGNGCSSYGNRNFWRDYTDWFGNTLAVDGAFAMEQVYDLSGGS